MTPFNAESENLTTKEVLSHEGWNRGTCILLAWRNNYFGQTLQKPYIHVLRLPNLYSISLKVAYILNLCIIITPVSQIAILYVYCLVPAEFWTVSKI